MGEATPHITAAELRILKVLWKSGAQNVRQVKDRLTDEGRGVVEKLDRLVEELNRIREEVGAENRNVPCDELRDLYNRTRELILGQ